MSAIDFPGFLPIAAPMPSPDPEEFETPTWADVNSFSPPLDIKLEAFETEVPPVVPTGRQGSKRAGKFTSPQRRSPRKSISVKASIPSGTRHTAKPKLRSSPRKWAAATGTVTRIRHPSIKLEPGDDNVSLGAPVIKQEPWAAEGDHHATLRSRRQSRCNAQRGRVAKRRVMYGSLDKSPRKCSVLEALDADSYPTTDHLETVATTADGRQLLRDALRASDRDLINENSSPDDPNMLGMLRQCGGSGDGWRFLLQRARHFRGEGKGAGKWGSRISRAESTRRAAQARGEASPEKVEYVEVDLLRAVMNSLRWKNVAVHPQLTRTNERHLATISELRAKEDEQAARLAEAEEEAHKAAEEAKELRARIKLMERTRAIEEPELGMGGMAIGVDGMDIPDPTTELIHAIESQTGRTDEVVVNLPPKTPNRKRKSKQSRLTHKKYGGRRAVRSVHSGGEGSASPSESAVTGSASNTDAPDWAMESGTFLLGLDDVDDASSTNTTCW